MCIHCSHIVIQLNSAGMRHIAVIHRHVVLGRGSRDGCCNRRSNKLKHHYANQKHETQRPKGRFNLRRVYGVTHSKVMQTIIHYFKSEIHEVQVEAMLCYLTNQTRPLADRMTRPSFSSCASAW